jgi:hypothetical protein
MLVCFEALAAAALRQRSSFDVDFDQKLPALKELQAKYIKNTIYDRGYSTHLLIGDVFDKAFRTTITKYGSSEERVKAGFEDDLIYMLKLLPEDTYQYIGPYLHTVPGMSEKVLNMPGIKETKNKFPTRIAPQLAHIEDLEFLSPYMYILLMPELWPENKDDASYTIPARIKPKVEEDPEFIAKVKALVNEDEYVVGGSSGGASKSDVRTIRITKDSPLTSADVKAFVRTIDKVNELNEGVMFMADLYTSGMLIDMWELENVGDVIIPSLKDIVNPCQRLAQKIRLMGKETDFLKVVGQEGFFLEEWAYTCDKTIKAYRVSRMSSNMLEAVMAYKKGLYNKDILNLGEKQAMQHFVAAQALLDMYSAPIDDVVEVRKNRKLLEDKFKSINYKILGAPISVK